GSNRDFFASRSTVRPIIPAARREDAIISPAMHAPPKTPREAPARPLAAGYVEKILRARVYDVAIESPLDRAPRLSQRLGSDVWLKREDLQPVFSFKLRGAYNKIAQLPVEALTRGVICSSAGNHAQG